MKIQTISSAHLKDISKLKQKKYRDETKTFLIETEKVLDEAIKSDWKVKEIYLTKDNLYILEKYKDTISNLKVKIFELSDNQFKKISSEVSPSGIAALVEKKIFNIQSFLKPKDKLILAFDRISDPGNLGTIIRTADWFGIKSVVLSKESVEITNPKVIRSSMGSIFHLNIVEDVDLIDFLELTRGLNYKAIGTTTSGKNIIKFSLPEKSILIFGNESKGISREILSKCDDIISIPASGKAESLNLSISTSIILYEMKRKELLK